MTESCGMNASCFPTSCCADAGRNAMLTPDFALVKYALTLAQPATRKSKGSGVESIRLPTPLCAPLCAPTPLCVPTPLCTPTPLCALS